MTITVEDNNAGQSLAAIVEGAVFGYESLPVTRQETILGGEPAVLLEGLPGRTKNRQLYALDGGSIYHLTLYPLDVTFAEVRSDVDRVWDVTVTTLAFLPESVTSRLQACPPSLGSLLAYISVGYAYCITYPSHLALMENSPRNVVSLFGPPLDQSDEPIRPQ